MEYDTIWMYTEGTLGPYTFLRALHLAVYYRAVLQAGVLCIWFGALGGSILQGYSPLEAMLLVENALIIWHLMERAMIFCVSV